MRIALLAALPVLLTACPAAAPPTPLGNCDASAGNTVDVVDAELVGDLLTVTVQHGGGCEEWTYTLCWPDQLFLESNPVQVNLEVLATTPQPDMCDAFLTESFEQDLTPLKEAWQDAYQQESGTITVHIEDQTVEYNF